MSWHLQVLATLSFRTSSEMTHSPLSSPRSFTPLSGHSRCRVDVKPSSPQGVAFFPPGFSTLFRQSAGVYCVNIFNRPLLAVTCCSRLCKKTTGLVPRTVCAQSRVGVAMTIEFRCQAGHKLRVADKTRPEKRFVAPSVPSDVPRSWTPAGQHAGSDERPVEPPAQRFPPRAEHGRSRFRNRGPQVNRGPPAARPPKAGDSTP